MPESGIDELGTLYACAVPIGNVADASARLCEVLAQVDAIACEDTRVTGQLLGRLGIEPRPRLLAHHDHNEQASAAGIVALLETGQNIALVSDAGTPSVSDPGCALVHAAHVAGIRVSAVAGPSAVAAAVSVAGARSDGYRFGGFLPRAPAELASLLRSVAHEVFVAFESPRRVRATLEVAAIEQPERIVTVCRELTKLHEQIVRGTAGELLDLLDEEVRGEAVLVFDALPVVSSNELDPRSLELVQAFEAEGVRRKVAARIVAGVLGGSARELYDVANAARHEDE